LTLENRKLSTLRKLVISVDLTHTSVGEKNTWQCVLTLAIDSISRHLRASPTQHICGVHDPINYHSGMEYVTFSRLSS